MPKASGRSGRGRDEREALEADRAFARDVLSVTAAVMQDDPIPENVGKEAVRLSLSLIFLGAQAEEFIKTCAVLNHPNMPIAAHGLGIIHDLILTPRAHPIERFIRGRLGYKEKVDSHDRSVRGFLAGCVRAVVRLQTATNFGRTNVDSAVQTVFADPRIREYCPTEKTLRHYHDTKEQRLYSLAETQEQWLLGVAGTVGDVIDITVDCLIRHDACHDASMVKRVRLNRAYVTESNGNINFELPSYAPIQKALRQLLKQAGASEDHLLSLMAPPRIKASIDSTGEP